MENEKRVWIYCRIANSNLELMEAQKNELLYFSERHGYKVVGEYQDTGSG